MDEKRVIELTVENCPELRAFEEKCEATAAEVERILNDSADVQRALELLAELGVGLELVPYALNDRSEEGSCNGDTR